MTEFLQMSNLNFTPCSMDSFLLKCLSYLHQILKLIKIFSTFLNKYDFNK